MTRILTALVLVASVGCATIRPNPTVPELDQTRKAAVIVMEAITSSLGIYESMLDVADTQQQAGQLSTATLRDLATIGKQFASTSDKALTILGKVTTMPSLNTTVVFVVAQLEPLIQRLENSGKDAMIAFGYSLRVLLAILQKYAITSYPPPDAALDCAVPAWNPTNLYVGCATWAQ